MNRRLRRSATGFILIFLLLFPSRPARADSIGNAVVAAVVGIVLVTAAITTAVVILVRRHPSLSGCTSRGAGGMEMISAEDAQHYLLTGDTVGIKAGERVRLEGKKSAKDPSGQRHFFVEKLRKDYGVCPVAP